MDTVLWQCRIDGQDGSAQHVLRGPPMWTEADVESAARLLWPVGALTLTASDPDERDFVKTALGLATGWHPVMQVLKTDGSQWWTELHIGYPASDQAVPGHSVRHVSLAEQDWSWAP